MHTVSVVIAAVAGTRNLLHVLPLLPLGLHEVILVITASQHDTAETARRLLPSVRVVETGPGIDGAVRAGVRAATGDIVLTLDPDASAGPSDRHDGLAAFLVDYAARLATMRRGTSPGRSKRRRRRRGA